MDSMLFFISVIAFIVFCGIRAGISLYDQCFLGNEPESVLTVLSTSVIFLSLVVGKSISVTFLLIALYTICAIASTVFHAMFNNTNP